MNGTEWVAPGQGATLRELLFAALSAFKGADKPTSLVLTGKPFTAYDLERVKEVMRRVTEHEEDKGF